MSFPQAHSRVHCLCSYFSQATSAAWLGDGQKLCGAKAAWTKERVASLEAQGGSDGTLQCLEGASICNCGQNISGLGRTLTGSLTAQDEFLANQVPLAVSEGEESVLHATQASRILPYSLSGTQLDAVPQHVVQREYVARMGKLGSIAPPGSRISRDTCNTASVTSSRSEQRGGDRTHASRSSTFSSGYDGNTRPEVERKFDPANLLPLTESQLDDSGKICLVRAPYRSADDDAQNYKLEGPGYASYWSSEEQAAEGRIAIPEAHKTVVPSTEIDTAVRQPQSSLSGDCAPLSKDEWHFLMRNLNHLLRAAAEEILRLDVGRVRDTGSTDERRQSKDQVNIEPSEQMAHDCTGLQNTGPTHPEATLAVQDTNVSSPSRESKVPAESDTGFQPHQHAPD